MARTKEEPRVMADVDETRRREIYAAIRRLENPTNQQIFGLLAQLPERKDDFSSADIIRELRGPLPGDPDAEPLPPE